MRVFLICLAAMLIPLPVRADTAVFAGGCFWCLEKDFESVSGVTSAVSGFTGGTLKNPTYEEVTAGGTGHYEAVQVTFDPATVSYDRLAYLFFRSIDPTDAGGQFCDRGDSYRSAIFADSRQAAIAEKAKTDARAALGQKIVTPILPAGPFYPASDYHQNYYRQVSIILTRAGPKSKSGAYKYYRKACGRDARTRQLWGSDAVFAH